MSALPDTCLARPTAPRVLPIYFVKAANISPMLDMLKELMPHFVLQACGPQTDYEASKAAPANSAFYR